MHARLQVIKVEEPTVLIVWSVERLFSLTMKKADLKCSSVAKTIEATLNKIWSKSFSPSLLGISF